MKIKVKNRSSLSVGYTIPEDNISRTFAPGETKNIEQSEIEKLSICCILFPFFRFTVCF